MAQNVYHGPSASAPFTMFERPRGTNDWDPEDMTKRRFVESRFTQLA